MTTFELTIISLVAIVAILQFFTVFLKGTIVALLKEIIKDVNENHH